MRIKYPFTDDLKEFKDNRYQVEARAKSLESSLKKKGLLEVYNDIVEDYIERGVWVKVSEDELKTWKDEGNPLHYVGHHCVYNDHSASTPVRLVTNSALKNCYSGPSLNDKLMKGPNSLNNLYRVLVKWRSFEVALNWDLSKAYHQLKTGELEKYMRLVVWRNGKADQPFQVYGHGVVGFGDLGASTHLEVTKDVASEKGKAIDEEAARLLVESSYVDDNAAGGSEESVNRMMG